MRAGPSTPIEPAGFAVDLVRGDDERAVGQRRHAGLGADGHLLPAVEDVAQQRHDHVLLLEDAEHLAHGLDGVEGASDARRAADEHLIRVVAALALERRNGETAQRVDDGVAGVGQHGQSVARRSGERARPGARWQHRCAPHRCRRPVRHRRRRGRSCASPRRRSTGRPRRAQRTDVRPTTCTDRTVASACWVWPTTTPA